MKIARDAVVKLLRDAPDESEAARAAERLPDPIDLDSDADLALMTELGIDPSIVSKLDGMGGSADR